MHAVAAFIASIIAFVSGFFAPAVASNSPVDVRVAQPAAAAAAQTEIAGNPFNDPAAASAVAAAIPPTTPAPVPSSPTAQTVINQPVIERIIERVVPQGSSGISADKLTVILSDFGQSIENRIAALNPPKAAVPEQVAATGNATGAFFPASQRIDQLTNTVINTPTITGGTISGASVLGYLPLAGGTLTGALSGTDLNLSGVLTAGTLNVGGLSSSGALFAPYFSATSTTATSSFAGGFTAANNSFNILQNGNVGIGTSTPNVSNYSSGATVLTLASTGNAQRAAIELFNPTAGTGSALGSLDFGRTVRLAQVAGTADGATDSSNIRFLTTASGGSLAERARITSTGNVGIGTTTPWGKLSITGSGTGTGLAFAVADSANTPRFIIQDNGNVGIGTTSPTSRLYIDSGTSGFGGNATAVIQGGGDTPTSVQLLLRNTREGGGTGNDYENEVHLRLQAGSTQDHRAYINFADYTGTDRWLTGRNASDTWILYSATSGHRMRMFNSVTDGHTEIASTGAYPVQINPSETGTSHGTGGFEVLGGGTYPAPLVFAVAPYTNDQAALRAFNNGSGYAPASLRLEASNAASRGQGIFHYNTVSDTSWFTGVPYNVAGAKWMVGYESNATWDPAVAQTSKALFTIQNNGNVGIGTTTPTRSLSIVGGASQLQIANSSGSAANMLFQNTDTGFGSSNGLWIGLDSSEKAWVHNYQNTALAFSTNNTERVTIDNTGNVGIGTTTPITKFDVNGSANFNGNVSIGDNQRGFFIDNFGTFSYGIGKSAAGSSANLQLYAGSGTPRVEITSTGFVGIGTTTPFSPLSVNGDIAIGGGNKTIQNIGGFLQVGTAVNQPLYLLTNGLQRMTVDSSGNVGIGTTTPSSKLMIIGPNNNYPTSAVPSLSLRQTSDTYGWDFIVDNTVNGNLHLHRVENGVSTEAVSFGRSTGNLGIGTTSPTAQLHTTGTVRFSNFGAGSLQTDANGNVSVSSDERLKNVQGAFAPGLAAVMQIDPIRYRWKPETGYDASTTYAGFSAQNVQTAIPEAVGVSPNGYLSLSDRPILAALVNATKELAQQLGDFAERITTKELTFDRASGNEIGVHKLCVDDICVTREQFAAMVAAAGQSGVSPSPNVHEDAPQAPVIELNGNASSTIEAGDTYNDLGARIVVPESDLNLGLVIVLDGATTTQVSIDTSQPGERTILYTVTSPTTGLTGSATRTVIITPAEQSPEQPANDNPFNAPANDNASATSLLNTEPAVVSL